MKLCRYDDARTGLVDGDTVYDITTIVEGITAGTIESEFADPLAAAIPALLTMEPATLKKGATRKLADVALLSAVRRPSKILAAPDNYKAHLEEMQKNKAAGGRQPSTLAKDGLFLKASSSIAGPAQGIDVRFLDRRTDHEVELVAVMGEDGKVAGYCVGLDITLRGTEERSIRKSIDGYSVIGPWIVTADALDSDNVDLILSLNGTIRQHTNTSDMLSNVNLLVAYALEFYTLYPGDLIFTGTPSGVGPIVPGDVIEASGSGIGTMTVAVRAYQA
jgi:2-keto-4-pentenoate hydratase/2-oxohepta-3-ene-1,7-dioic acid hydratase in catechol pathway